MENKTLYVNDIIMRCLLKWKIAIIAAILGAAALSAFGVYRQQKAREEMMVSIDETDAYAAAAAEAEENLTDTQIAEVYLALDRYVAYQRNYNELYDYYFGSVIGQIDATAVDTVTLSYYLDTHFKVTYPEIQATDPIDSIFAYITGNFVNSELCSNISQIIGEDLEEQYIPQLVGAWRSGNILYVSVKGRDENECNRMAELTKLRVNTLSKEAQETIADFDITFMESKYNRAPDGGLMDSQFNQSNRMYTYQNAMNSTLSYMSEDQRQLLKMLTFEKLEQEKQEKIDAGLLEPEEEPEPEPVVVPEIDYIQSKYLLVGAFLGIFVVGGCILLQILLGGRLLTQNDIRDVTGIARLGTWNAGKAPRGLDKWIIKAFGGDGVQFSADESRGMTAAGIRLMSEKEGYKRLYITGTSNDAAANVEAEKLAELLGKAGVNAQYGRSILYDAESLEAMTQSDAVVLLEKIDVSKDSEIREEISICNRQQIPIMGYIAIR